MVIETEFHGWLDEWGGPPIDDRKKAAAAAAAVVVFCSQRN